MGISDRVEVPELEDVPARTRLRLRELVRGLEAEVGAARGRARELQDLLEHERVRYREHLAGLRAEIDAQAAARDSHRCDHDAARSTDS